MAVMPPSSDSPQSTTQSWTAQTVGMGPEILDRMEKAVAKVRERLLRATKALNEAGIPYAVAGGNAVASWVATVDEGAVRNTRDVDLLVRRADLPAMTVVLEKAGLSQGRCSMWSCFAMAKRESQVRLFASYSRARK